MAPRVLTYRSNPGGTCPTRCGGGAGHRRYRVQPGASCAFQCGHGPCTRAPASCASCGRRSAVNTQHAGSDTAGRSSASQAARCAGWPWLPAHSATFGPPRGPASQLAPATAGAGRSGRSPGIYSQLRPAPAPSPARPETEGSPLHDEAPQPTAAAGCAAAWCPRCRCCYKHEAEVRSASRR